MKSQAEFEAEFVAWCQQKKADQQARRAAARLRMRRLRVRDPLPNARVWLRGPKWQRAFHVQHLAFSAVHPPCEQYPNPTDQKFWWYDFEDDVRELACERLRFDVYAEWSDPRERLQARS